MEDWSDIKVEKLSDIFSDQTPDDNKVRSKKNIRDYIGDEKDFSSFQIINDFAMGDLYFDTWEERVNEDFDF